VKRSILAFVAGLLTWVVVATLLDHGLRLLLPDYAAVEPSFRFTLGMMAGRLLLAAAASVAAGAVTDWIAPASPRTSWVLGLVLLAVFIPSHIRLWHVLPLWYHLSFLLTLVPLVLLGARLRRRLAGASPGSASHAGQGGRI
jgi:hypothetical protein